MNNHVLFGMAWHGSITEEDRANIDRVQKNSLRVTLILSNKTYKHALDKLNLESLEERRKQLSLRVALKCSNNIHTNRYVLI